MSDFLLIISLLPLAFAVWGIFRLLFKKHGRKAGLRDFAIGFVLFLGIAFIGTGAKDTEAISAGFLSASDQRAAKEAGYASPEEWSIARRAANASAAREASLENAAAREAEAATKAAELDAARSAGFTDVDDHKLALADGFTDATEWKKSIRLAAIEGASGKSFVSAVEYDDGVDYRLVLSLKTNGLDGGSLDFFSFANVMEKIAGQFRDGPLDYDEVLVTMFVPTLDRYGNSDQSNGGRITWIGADLAKLQADAPQTFLLRLASDVSLGRFGKEMAVHYCAENDLGDSRYCS